MYKRGSKILAAALALSMTVTPLMPVASAYATTALDATANEADSDRDSDPDGDITTPEIEIGNNGQPADEQPGDEQPGDQQPGDEQPKTEGDEALCPTEKDVALNVTSGTFYETIQDALAAAEAGDTIKLVRGLRLSKTLEVGKEVTLDLNGRTITRDAGNNAKSLVLVTAGGDLTVDDTSGNDGYIMYDASHATTVEVSGSFTLKGGSIVSCSGDAIVHRGKKLTIDGGAVMGSVTGVLKDEASYRDDSIVTINGGEIDGAYSVCNKTAGTADEVRASFVINGGSFSDDCGNGDEFTRPEGKTLKKNGKRFTLQSDNGCDFMGVDHKVNLTLRDNIGMNITLSNYKLGDDLDEYSLKCWFGDDEEHAEVRKLTKRDIEKPVVFTCSAKEATDQAHVYLYRNGSNEPIDALDLSVSEYCDLVLGRKDTTPEDRNLITALLRYCSASQRYFKYRTDDLADSFLPETTGWDASIQYGINRRNADGTVAETLMLDNCAARKMGSTSLAKKMSMSLSLESQTAIRFYITPADGVKAADIPVTVDGREVTDSRGFADSSTRAAITRETLDDGRVLVTVDCIKPQDLDHQFKFTVGKGDDSKTIYYSALSYAASKGDDKNTADLAYALWGYSCATKQ